MRPGQTKVNQNGKPIRHKLHVKKGDTVQVISGREKGKVGEIIQVFPKTSQVLVEGVNKKTKHVKPREEGQAGQTQVKEFPIHSSNVMHYSSKEKVASRICYTFDEQGKKVRKLIKTGEILK